MSNNGITKIESQTFAGLGSVVKIDLANNDITEIGSQGFAGLGSVTTLDLSNNNITDTVAADGLAEFIGSKTTIILRGNPAECWTGGIAKKSGLYVDCVVTRVPTFINPNITHAYVRYYCLLTVLPVLVHFLNLGTPSDYH